MATSLHHHRTGSGTKKQHSPHARSSKPTLLTKRGTGSSKGAQKAVHVFPEVDDDESMAASFLQYCATCEKQIIVPSNSLLYCSESCRKRDKSTSYYTADHSPPLTPFTQFSPEDLRVRDIIPPRSPTAAPCSNRSSIFYPSDTDTDSLNQSQPSSTPGHARKESEAARYLRQFQSATSSDRTSSTSTSSTSSSSRRPRYSRSHSSAATIVTGGAAGSTTHSAAPSLSHTPHSVSSLAGMPFTPSLNTARPLPPRKNPYSSSAGARSVDLVTPFAALTTSSAAVIVAGDTHAATVVGGYGYGTGAGDGTVYRETLYGLKSAPSAKTCLGLVAEGQISYEKRETLPVALSSPGSLGRLFAEKVEKRRWM